MKKILLIILSVQLSISFAQNTEEPQPNWTKKGIITFLVNQSSFENWIQVVSVMFLEHLALITTLTTKKTTGLGRIN
jgi:hypothetical protein